MSRIRKSVDRRCARRRRRAALLAGGLAAGLSLLAAAAEEASGADALKAGRERFDRTCAVCHGLDARGDGPLAVLLRVAPPDLTGLTRANRGAFPFSEIYRVIDGRDRPLAHGTPDMPVWGTRLLRKSGDETWVRGRILELILYLESIQEP